MTNYREEAKALERVIERKTKKRDELQQIKGLVWEVRQGLIKSPYLTQKAAVIAYKRYEKELADLNAEIHAMVVELHILRNMINTKKLA